jgi:translation initiation factor 2 subunit 2
MESFMSDNYEDLLKKASSMFAKSNTSDSRLKIPEPDVIFEGKSTIIRNFLDITDLINREPQVIAKYLMKEFGIGVTINGRRLIINRKLSASQISKKFSQYMDSYVKCYECGSPDTVIQRVGRIDLLTCKACGAQHPIKLTRDSKSNEADLEEGKQYNITINEVGKSGEGRTSFKGYSIIVAGGKKGENLRVVIKKIRNGTAIAEIVSKS